MIDPSASEAPEFYVQFAIDVLEGRLARIDMDLADSNWQPGRREIEIACNAMRSAAQLLKAPRPRIKMAMTGGRA